MATVTTTYSINDLVYFVIKGTSDIVPAQVIGVHINNPLSDEAVCYDLVTSHFNGVAVTLQFVAQSELYTFIQAKSMLLAYLNQRILTLTNMTIPPVI